MIQFRLMPRSMLRLNPDNPKTITEEDVDRMVQLLQAHGFKDPVEARAEDGLVLAGHRRLLAADKLGLSLIPTILHEGMTDVEAQAYTIAHTQAEKHVGWNRALLADQVSGLPEEYQAGLGFSEKDYARLFDLDRAEEGGAADGVAADGAGAQASGLVRGESWIIGPVTYNVLESLEDSQLDVELVRICKIEKLLKHKAIQPGEGGRPLAEVLKERRGEL